MIGVLDSAGVGARISRRMEYRARLRKFLVSWRSFLFAQALPPAGYTNQGSHSQAQPDQETPTRMTPGT
jgi:hypothetical protein